MFAEECKIVENLKQEAYGIRKTLLELVHKIGESERSLGGLGHSLDCKNKK